MPKSKSKTYTFYDDDGESYPFFAPDGKESTAIRRALDWARPRRIKLYRVKHGTSPHIRAAQKRERS